MSEGRFRSIQRAINHGQAPMRSIFGRSRVTQLPILREFSRRRQACFF